MAENTEAAEPTEIRSCAACSKPIPGDADFCPSCGAKVISSTVEATVEAKVSSILATRLQEQSNLVRELGDNVEDIVWKRFKGYALIISFSAAIILAIVAFVGVKTFNDFYDKIEPIASAAEKRAQDAKLSIDNTASRIEVLKSNLDQLSTEIDDQTKRATDRSGDVSQRIEALQRRADAVETEALRYEARFKEISAHLEEMAKNLETRSQQISAQATIVSIREVYPTIGQSKFVTLRGLPFAGKENKKDGEKW